MGAYMPLESSSLPIGTLVPPYHCKIDSILTTDTKAQVWDNCIPGRQDEILDDAALRRRLASYVRRLPFTRIMKEIMDVCSAFVLTLTTDFILEK
jgi:hypothetical protein